MLSLTLESPRLILVAADADVARREAAGDPSWSDALGVPRPERWPPPLNDAASLDWFARNIAREPAALGWFGWYVLLKTGDGANRLAGNCGFKGRPDARGTVEIGYSLLPAHHGRGYGTELVAQLAAWAFGHAAVRRIVAETYPELVASVRVLEKNGFAFSGRGTQAGLILFELRRRVHEQRTTARLTAPDSSACQSAES